MKKILILIAAGLMLTTVSCRKIYTCSCVVNEETIVTTYNNEYKKNVESYCDQTQKAARLEDAGATCKVEESLNQQP